MQSKNCLQCNIQFFKKVNCSLKEWNTKARFCSKPCANNFRRGKPNPEHSIRLKAINLTPWNKGLNKSDPRIKIYSDRMKIHNPMKRPEVQAKSSQSHFGNYHSVEIRQKMSAIQKRRVKQGLNNFYIDGRTPETKRLRNSGEYAIWRDEVFRRDAYVCQDCGIRGGRLEAHHIFRWSVYIDLRFVVGNGITLCRKCHEKTKSYRTKSSYHLIINLLR